MTFRKLKIVECRPQNNYKLWLLFDDGVSGEVNPKNLVGKGVFAAWEFIDFFNSVRVDKKTDTVSWGEDLDLDPYVLHNKLLTNKPQLLSLLNNTHLYPKDKIKSRLHNL